MTISLQHVRFMPSEFSAGILYVSLEFGVAIHLCPCGCNSKIVTPIGPTDWKFTEYENKPTLYPSIGNWQLPCRSHYWISAGEIDWAPQWTDEQINRGWEYELERDRQYYATKDKPKSKLSKLIKVFKKLLHF